MSITSSVRRLMKLSACAAVLIATGDVALPRPHKEAPDPPSAAPPVDRTFHQKIEVSGEFDVPNFCTGEIIHEQWTIVATAQVTQDATGRYHILYHENFHATGIGSFGNEYIIQDQNKIRQLVFADLVSFESTETFDFVQISRGPDQNTRYSQKLRYTFTLNPDGTIDVDVKVNDAALYCPGEES